MTLTTIRFESQIFQRGEVRHLIKKPFACFDGFSSRQGHNFITKHSLYYHKDQLNLGCGRTRVSQLCVVFRQAYNNDYVSEPSEGMVVLMKEGCGLVLYTWSSIENLILSTLSLFFGPIHDTALKQTKT